jgi:hypothetical protein
MLSADVVSPEAARAVGDYYPVTESNHVSPFVSNATRAGSMYASCMGVEGVRKTLTANIGRRLRIVFADGVTQSVEIGSVDDEGFTHSGPEDGGDPHAFWTRFESVRSIQQDPLSR